jgi:phosphomannomutase
MLKGDILIGGEESGGIGIKNHIPERDGILAGLLLLEMMAMKDKSLPELIDSMTEEFGELHYRRVDYELLPEQGKSLIKLLEKSPPDKIAGRKVIDIKGYDGLKFILEGDSWILLRQSGTEPVLRVYVEAPSLEEVDKIISFGKEVILGKGRFRN